MRIGLVGPGALLAVPVVIAAEDRALTVLVNFQLPNSSVTHRASGRAAHVVNALVVAEVGV